ncbi:MAG: hypothetical protein IJ088_11275 [Clostridia bacterium]|nr:hypothetical protein [Clostridia bacterium]
MNDNEKKVPLADDLSSNVSAGGELENDCHGWSSILRDDKAENAEKLEDNVECTRITKFIR